MARKTIAPTGEQMPTTDDLVRVTTDEVGVRTLTLDDPDNRNAWSEPMENRYFHLLDEAAADPAVKVIVLTGAGRSFCPGLAMGRLSTVSGQGLRIAHRRPQYTPRQLAKPIIAAINGACAGIGLVQAMQCDVRFAASGAKMSTSFARRGLGAEYNLGWMLPRLIGVENALDLLLSARIFDAEEALRLGLVSRVSAPGEVLASAQEYARDMAVNCAPAAMAMIRRQVYDDMDATFNEGLRRSFATMTYLNSQPDLAEGIASYVEKRPPRFAPLPPDFDAAVVADVTLEPFPKPPV